MLLGDGRGGFTIVPVSAYNVAPVAIAPGDFNGDAKSDLAVARTNNAVSILLGDGHPKASANATMLLPAFGWPASRVSSTLDDIRPERWTPEFTDELLQLLWILERTVSLASAQANLLGPVIAGLVLPAADLPPVPPDSRSHVAPPPRSRMPFVCGLQRPDRLPCFGTEDGER